MVMEGDKIILLGGVSNGDTGEIVQGKFYIGHILENNIHHTNDDSELQKGSSFAFKMVEKEPVQSPTRLDS